MKILLNLFIIPLIFYESKINENSSCNKTKDYCNMIDTIVLEYYSWHTGNTYMNDIIPIIEEKSGIQANCSKGFLGYSYNNDSIFLNDITKWRKYFNCKHDPKE